MLGLNQAEFNIIFMITGAMVFFAILTYVINREERPARKAIR